MTQLYLKERRLRAIVLNIFLLFYGFVGIGQEQEEFSNISKNADAYYLHFYTDVTYKKNWGGYKKYTSIDNKLVINNTNGVENYAFLDLSEYESNHIKEISIKTLKADGTIVELDSSLAFKRTGENKKINAIKYPIPAVEPGDTIYTSYVIYENLKKSELLSYVGLHKNLPSKNSQYTINTKPDLTVRYKTYNNFPKPKIISNDTLIYLKFSKDNLNGYKESQYSCFLCELPYLYYALVNKDSELRTWKDVYNDDFNAITQPLKIDYSRSTYYNRWKRRIIGEAKDSSKYYKFKLLYNEVVNHFKMTDLVPKEFIKSSGYFLKEKKFDPISIRRFYRQILEDLEIDYWAVFAKSKRTGNIDYNYIRKGEFDHTFFALEKQNRTLEFLYPHSTNLKYQINEIPTSIYNTSAILVRPAINLNKKNDKKFITRDLKLAKVDSVSIVEITIPGMNPSYNAVNQIVFSKVNLKDKTIHHKSRFRISGGLSTELRDFFNTMSNNEEANSYYDALSEYEGNKNAIQIDSVISRKISDKKPFSYTINSSGTVNEVLGFINDNLISFSVDKLISHSQIETISTNSDLNYYLDYSYSDNLIFTIEFPKKIEILGIENGNIKLSNEYGEYIFQINKIKENKIRLTSSYKIKKSKIPKESYTDLKAINDEVQKAKSKKFIIKIKQ